MTIKDTLSAVGRWFKARREGWRRAGDVAARNKAQRSGGGKHVGRGGDGGPFPGGGI